MSRSTDRVADYLKRNLDDDWTDAEANAAVLADEIQSLDWACRATAIDWFMWQLGTRMLGEDEAESIIDRDLATMHASPITAHYVDVAKHTLAAVLMQIDEQPCHVDDPYQAVLFALSPLAAHRVAFEDWVVTADLDALVAAFRDLPGHAFLAMASIYDDTAVVMLARDGFWRTMLGRHTGL